jgi:hypothetical protein
MGYLQNAMAHAYVSNPDERGLMPLDEARELVKALKVFDSGEDIYLDDGFCTTADRVWAALCSLENAAEFLQVTRGVEWLHPPRGKDNTVFQRKCVAGALRRSQNLLERVSHAGRQSALPSALQGSASLQ